MNKEAITEIKNTYMPTYQNVSGKVLVIPSHYKTLQPDEIFETPYPVSHDYIDNGLLAVIDINNPPPILPKSEDVSLNVGDIYTLDIKPYKLIVIYIVNGSENINIHFDEITTTYYVLSPNDIFQYENEKFHKLILENPTTNSGAINVRISMDY